MPSTPGKRPTLLAWAALLALVSTPQNAPAHQRLHPGLLREAIEHLHAMQYEQAQEKAMELANCPVDPVPRAWLIIGDARVGLGKYSSAVRAYRLYLSENIPPESRGYVLRKLDKCRRALSTSPSLSPPGELLDERQLSELGRIYAAFFTEYTDNFVVQARNPMLARITASHAQAYLNRISASIMGEQRFPHMVHVYIWANHEEYLQNARDAEDWSGGNFSVRVVDGELTRRIDLTQCGDDGEFLLSMIDRTLPHELSHLVLLERFGDAPCPLFINEGLASLVEWHDNHNRIITAAAALEEDPNLRLHDLLCYEQHDNNRPEAFYALAYSFTSYLYSRIGEEAFGDLLEHIKDGCSVEDSIERALYVPPTEGFLDDLGASWRQHALADAYFLRMLMLD